MTLIAPMRTIFMWDLSRNGNLHHSPSLISTFSPSQSSQLDYPVFPLCKQKSALSMAPRSGSLPRSLKPHGTLGRLRTENRFVFWLQTAVREPGNMQELSKLLDDGPDSKID